MSEPCPPAFMRTAPPTEPGTPTAHSNPVRPSRAVRRATTGSDAAPPARTRVLLVSQEVVEEVLDRGMLEVLPLTHIRGRSLHDAFVIVDEAQSLEKNVLLTVLSRIGQSSRVVLTHDVAQRDNLRVGRHDGVVAVVEQLKGHPLFAHVTLTRSERSPIAALVTEMLEGATL